MEAVRCLASGVGSIVSICCALHCSAQEQTHNSDGVQQALSLEDATGAQAALVKEMIPLRMAISEMVSKLNRVPLGNALELWDATTLPILQAHGNELIAIKARVLADHFSPQELQEMNVFFRSPTGRKLIANQDAVAKDYMIAAEPLIENVIQKAIAPVPKTSQSGGVQ